MHPPNRVVGVHKEKKVAALHAAYKHLDIYFEEAVFGSTSDSEGTCCPEGGGSAQGK